MNQHNPDRTVQTQKDRSRSYTVQPGFVRRTLTVVGIVAAVAIGLWLLWFASNVILLVFTGILWAVFLSSLAGLLSNHTPIPYRWSVIVVVLAILVVSGVAAWLWAPRIIQEAAQLVQQLPRSLDQLRDRITQTAWGQEIMEWLPPPSEILPSQSEMLARARNILFSVVRAITGLILIFFVGLYLALNPDLYERGIIRLVPTAKRPHAREIMHDLGYTLRWWLVGRISSMVIIGVLTTIGLWILGMPLTLVLGVLAGLLEYIPNFGPILAAVPAVLIAFASGQPQVLYVIALYAAVQMLESYLITPLILKRAVSLPPALTITVLVLFGLLFGFLGLLLATPLAVVLLVLVKKLYIEDVLGDTSVEVPGEQETRQQAQTSAK